MKIIAFPAEYIYSVLEFWKRIQEALKDSELSMAEVSRLTGIPHATISNWIRNDRYPPIDLAARMAKAIGISLEWMVYGKESLDEYYEDIEPDKFFHLFRTLESLNDKQISVLEKMAQYLAESNEPGAR